MKTVVVFGVGALIGTASTTAVVFTMYAKEVYPEKQTWAAVKRLMNRAVYEAITS